MKYHSTTDQALHEMETDNSPKRLFIKNRNFTVEPLKDFLRSQATKRAWTRHRSRFMFAIRSFHRGIEGSRLHRQLSRFFDMRTGVQHTALSSYRESLKEIHQDLLQESCYYRSLVEQAELELLIEEICGELISG